MRRNILRAEFQPLGQTTSTSWLRTTRSDTPLDVGDAFYIEDLDGVLGTGASMDLEDDNVWESRYDGRRSTTARTATAGGW